MASLKGVLPEESKTVFAIYEHWREKGESNQRPVRTLGASRVGRPCERALWYEFRHCCKPSFDGRMYRLFDRGDLEEPRVVADLRAIGCTVHEVDQATGEQFRVADLSGHLSGYLDGAVLGMPEASKTWHVLEIKTHNAKSFRKIASKGVKEAKPEHYAQCMIYMHLTGMTRALYVAVNKDTDELYTERIRYDATEAATLIERARHIIFANEPPPRISKRSDYYLCKMCDARDVCFGAAVAVLPVPSLSCRQCCHSTPTLNGVAHWTCEKHCKALSDTDQHAPCLDHLVLPGILEPLVSPSEFGTDDDGYGFIVFRDDTWGEWKHGRANGAYSSQELMKLPLQMLSNDMLQSAKELFAGTVPDGPDTLTRDYLPEETRLVWTGRLNAAVISEAWRSAYGEALEDQQPIRQLKQPTYMAVEYPGQRVIFADSMSKQAEIRDKEGMK